MTKEAPYILIVDDDPDMRWMGIKIAREIIGYEIREAPNGAEALILMRRSGRPVLVITDLEMPVLDGVSMIEAMLRDKDLREVPVLVVSGNHTIPKIVRDYGAMFLRKPAAKEDMLRAMRTTIVTVRSGESDEFSGESE